MTLCIRSLIGKYSRDDIDTSEGSTHRTKLRTMINFLAIRSQSVCRFTTASHVLRCHPWPCMLLNLRFQADSNPSLSASTLGLMGLDPISSTVSSIGELEDRRSRRIPPVLLTEEMVTHLNFTQETAWKRT